MSRVLKGEFLTINRYCGPVQDLALDSTSRVRYDIHAPLGFLTLRKKEAQEVILLLQAALLDWKGSLEE